MKNLLICLFLLLTACDSNIFSNSDNESAKTEEAEPQVEQETEVTEPQVIVEEPEETKPQVKQEIQDSFTIEDVLAMHSTGVRIALVGEKTTQVVPQNLSPSQLTNAEILDFNGEKIYVLPDWLAKFKQLRRLVLKNAGLPFAEILKLKALTKLVVLDLSGNSIAKQSGREQNLTELWQVLTNLHELYLSQLQANVTQIGDLSSLEHLIELDLSHNQIEDVNLLKLNALSGLRKLNLSFNQISDFNPTMISVVSIQELNLQHNQLSKLPFTEDMPQLGSLNVSENSNTERNNGLVIDEAYGGLFVIKNIAQLSVDDNAKVPLSLRKKLLRNTGGMITDRYKDNGNGTVTDIKTKLQWMQCSLGQTFSEGSNRLFQCKGEANEYTWEEALDIARAFSFADYSDWRLPTIKELNSLVYCSNGKIIQYKNDGYYSIETEGARSCKSDSRGNFKSPTIEQSVFPNTASGYWSSSPSASNSNYAWGVYFDYGSDNANGYRNNTRYVRDVRSGQ